MHWSLDGLANSCLCDTTRKCRYTRDQRGRKKCWSLDNVPWTEHFSSKIALEVRISDHRRYRIPGILATRVYVTPRGSTTRRTISVRRKKCWNLNSVPWTEHFSSKIALKVRISDARIAPTLPLLLRVCHTATRRRDTIPQRWVSFLVNSVLQLIKLRTSSTPGACISTWSSCKVRVRERKR